MPRYIIQISLTDDVAGAVKVKNLKMRWDELVSQGQKVGCYVNGRKSWIIFKFKRLLEFNKNVFNGTGIKFTTEGKRHLGFSHFVKNVSVIK